jgi:all-trans-nonaprenyl-diphosphate synthase
MTDHEPSGTLLVDPSSVQLSSATIKSSTDKPSPPSRLSDFYAVVSQELQQVRTCLTEIVPPDSPLLRDTLDHSLSKSGKLLRPVLTLLCDKALRAEETPLPDTVTQTAAVSELIHVATLLHDDVLDDADVRRGKPTVSSVWGNTAAILTGDFLLAQASLKLARIGNIRVVGIFSQVLADLCDGELEQIRLRYNLNTTWGSYLKKTVCKTASLFAAACESVGVLHALPEEQTQLLRAYGHHFGVAFQLIDDLLDFTASEEAMGKPVMDDLRNGLINAPVLLMLDVLATPEKEAIENTIQQLFEMSQGSERPGTQVEFLVQQVQASLRTADAFPKTQRLAQESLEKAAEAIAFLPSSEAKDALLGLLGTVLVRSA